VKTINIDYFTYHSNFDPCLLIESYHLAISNHPYGMWVKIPTVARSTRYSIVLRVFKRLFMQNTLHHWELMQVVFYIQGAWYSPNTRHECIPSRRFRCRGIVGIRHNQVITWLPTFRTTHQDCPPLQHCNKSILGYNFTIMITTDYIDN